MRKCHPAAILFLLAAFVSAWTLPAGAATAEPESLFLLAARDPGSWQYLAGASALTRLYTADKTERLLAFLPETQARSLARLGLEVLKLDTDARQKSYYLISALRPGALQQAQQRVRIVWEDSSQAVAAVDDSPAGIAQIEALTNLGIHLRRLQARPFNPAGADISPHLPEQITPVPAIQTMIDQVSSSAANSTDGGLSGEWPVLIGGIPYTILTRYSRTSLPIQLATQYTFEHFQGLGLDTTYHEYTLPGSGERRNVVAEQIGQSQPERILLITAHLDSTSEDAINYAPGADDNASGSSAVMIAAQILSQYNFDCTLRYALFTGEEQGLVGSEAYAADVFAAGENIEAVLNLDMIGYNSDAFPVIELHTRPGNSEDLAIANLFSDVLTAYNLELTPEIVEDGIQASDHAAFWQYDYPGILAIEDFEDFTPYYHNTDDQLETLNLNYFTNFIKAAVGSFAHMGCLQPSFGSLSGVVTSAASGAPVTGASITVSDNSVGEWRTYSGLNGGYWLSLPPGLYQVKISADGYAPFIANGIPVVENQTTTLDAALETCQAVASPDFTYTPAAPSAGEVITFTGMVSGSLPVDFQWHFGDRTTGSGEVVTHTYAISDVYSVYFYASNCGGTVAASRPVAVTGASELQIPASPFSVLANPGDILTRTLLITNTGTSDLTWNIAEQPDSAWLEVLAASGTTPPGGRSSTHLRLTAPAPVGVYTATLQISSNDDAQPQAELVVELTVTDACIAITGLDFTYLPVGPLSGQPVTFSASLITSSMPITFSWSFGDGSPPVIGAGLYEVLHTFPAVNTPQAYPATLHAANDCSAAVEIEKLVVTAPWRVYLPWTSVEP